MDENKNPEPIKPPKLFISDNHDSATIPNSSERQEEDGTKKIETITKKQEMVAKLKNKKLWTIVGGGILSLAILAGVSYTISKIVTTQPTDPTVITIEEGNKKAEALKNDSSKTTKPGTEVAEGSEGKFVGGLDYETNTPYVQGVKIDSIKETPLNDILGEDFTETFTDVGGRAFYVTVTITADPKPSNDTTIPLGVLINNNMTPVDTSTLNVFPKDNPACLYGVKTWGEVKGNTTTKCFVVVTRNNEPIGEIILASDASLADPMADTRVKMTFTIK